MPTLSPFRNYVDHFIQHCIEHGLLQILDNKFCDLTLAVNRILNFEDLDETKKPLQLDQLASIFYIYFAGLILSTSTLFGEVCFRKIQNAKIIKFRFR